LPKENFFSLDKKCRLTLKVSGPQIVSKTTLRDSKRCSTGYELLEKARAALSPTTHRYSQISLN
jgi:hypothetical protein